MSKKDFILIAATLRPWCEGGDATHQSIARDFADMLYRNNVRFDRARFLKACGVEDAS